MDLKIQLGLVGHRRRLLVPLQPALEAVLDKLLFDPAVQEQLIDAKKSFFELSVVDTALNLRQRDAKSYGQGNKI